MSEQPKDHTSESIAKLRQIYTNPDQLAELESTLAFYQKRESETTNPIVKRFYSICLSLFREDYLNQDMTDGQTRMVIIRSKYRNLFDIISGQYDRFEPQDHQRIKALLDGLIDVEHIHSSSLSINKSVDEAIRSRFVREMYADNLTAVPAHQLFSAMHEYDVVEKWNAAIKYGSVPQKLRLDYQRWSKNKKKFIVECAERHQSRANPMAALEAEAAKAVDDLSDSLGGLAKVIGPDSPIGRMFPVLASEQLQAEIDKQTHPTIGHDGGAVQQGSAPASERTLKDFYLEKARTWEQRMMESENSEVAKVYQRILLATPGQEITPIIPLSETEKQEFGTNKIASIIKSSVACFDSMMDQDRGEIGAFITQIMNAISERSAHITGEFYSVCEPKSLFRAVHMFGFEQSFNRMIDRGFVTPHIRNSYQEWKRQGKNKIFIAECRERNAKLFKIGHEPIGDINIPSEDSIYSGSATILQSHLDLNVTTDEKNENFNTLQRRFVANVYNPRRAGFQELESRGRTEAETWPRQRLYQLMFDFGMQRDDETFTQYKERTLKARRAFIPYVIKHGQDFTMVERWAIDICLSHFYETGDNTGALARKAIKDSLDEVVPDQLFRVMHTYGDINEFQKSINSHLIPDRFRNLYPKWVKQNADFIAAADQNRLRQKHFVELVGFASDSDNLDRRVTGGILLHHLQKQLFEGPRNSAFDMTDEVINSLQWQSIGNDPQQAGQNFVRLIAQNWSTLEVLSPYLRATAAILPLIASYGGEESHYNPINTIPLPELFAYVRLTESEDLFRGILNPNDKFPRVTYAMYESWKADPVAFEQEMAAQGISPGDDTPESPAVILEEREMAAAAVIDPLLADPRVTYIDVHHPLVTSGNQTQSMGYSPVDEDRNLEIGLNQGDDFQDRTRTLIKVLLGDAKSGVQKITIRWDRRNANDDNIEGRPYNLIDIEMQDGSQSRVAVCDYKGHMTYIERDASEMNDQETLQISSLRANRKVWTAVHVNDKQWCERIQEVLYTSLDSLTPELKSRSYWHGLKGVLTETFAATVMATGNLPAATDDRIVEHGPLAGRTTYSRMYNAANRGAVSGLEKGTTYKKLFTELSSGQMPELNQFMNRAPLQAVDILAAWEDVRQELGPEITIDDFADCVKVDIRDHRAINLALRFGAVQGFDKVSSLERIMADKSLAPKSLRAFLRLVEQVNPMALAA